MVARGRGAFATLPNINPLRHKYDYKACAHTVILLQPEQHAGFGSVAWCNGLTVTPPGHASCTSLDWPKLGAHNACRATLRVHVTLTTAVSATGQNHAARSSDVERQDKINQLGGQLVQLLKTHKVKSGE
jgi:hypothetical protein